MFFLIWWILIIDCVVEFKIIYGNERVIIMVPVHIKKMHHTKMIYKIIEKPVPADTIWTPSTNEIGYREGAATTDAFHRMHGDENQTVTSTFRHHERGPEPAPVDHRGRGYDVNYPHGNLRDGDHSKWPTAHGARVEGDRGPHGHVDAYGSNANVPQHQRHVHGPRHPALGNYANDVWYGKQAGEGVNHAVGDHNRGHSVGAVHGHFGGVLRPAGDHEHGGVRINHVKAARLRDHRHRHVGGYGRGNAGSPWRAQDTSDPGFRGQNQYSWPAGLLGPHHHGDHPHGNVAEFGATGTGGAPDHQYGPGVADAASPGQVADHHNPSKYGFPNSLHDHQFTSNPGYGHRETGGYQVRENVADFNGMFSIAVPPMHLATAAQAYHNYPSPVLDVGSDNTVDRRPSVPTIASPPSVNGVYYTLDPVVPYNDIALRSQRETAQRRRAENIK